MYKDKIDMKKEQKEHLKLRKHLECYNKRRFKDMMKRWKKKHYSRDVIETYSSRNVRIYFGYDENGCRMLEVIPTKISRFDWIDHKWIVEGDYADAANMAFRYLLLEHLVRNDKPALRWLRKRAMTFKAGNGEAMSEFKDFGKKYVKALMYSEATDGIESYTTRWVHAAYGYNHLGERVVSCVAGGLLGDYIAENDEEASVWMWEYSSCWACFRRSKGGRKWFNRIVRTFNYKDMNFGEFLDEYERKCQEERRQAKLTKKKK